MRELNPFVKLHGLAMRLYKRMRHAERMRKCIAKRFHKKQRQRHALCLIIAHLFLISYDEPQRHCMLVR